MKKCEKAVMKRGENTGDVRTSVTKRRENRCYDEM